MLRHRAGSAAATLIALATGVMILMSMGTLVESGLRFRATPQRYAAADLVVANRDITLTSESFDGDTTRTTLPLPEGGTVPATLAEQIRQLPGVAAAVADSSIAVVPLEAASVPADGHGWSSAALTPYRLVAGSPPRADGEVVVDARLAAAGALRPGGEADLLVGGDTRRYRISGVAEQTAGTGPTDGSGQPAAVFFTDGHAAEVAPHPGRADAIGVVTATGADRAEVSAAVRRLARAAGVETYTGEDRGLVAPSDAAARGLLVTVGAAFGGYVGMLIVFVVAGTVGLSVRHRRRDLALLRAIAATPGQVRSMIMAEAALVSGAAAVPGVLAGAVASRWVQGELVTRGFVPETFPMATGVLPAVAAVLATTLVAVLSALIAARRVTAIRPTEALAEVAVEPAGNGRVRLVAGLVTLAGATSSSAFTVGASGQAALAGAIGMLYLFVLAVGLLAPWINRFAARLLAPVLRRVWGASGYLASANLRANAQGMATVLTALVLAVGFGGSVWFLQDNLQRQTIAQSRDGMLAQRALVSPAGLPATAAEEIRRIPGVQAATGVRRTAVIVEIFDGAETVDARAIDPAGAAATTDLAVTEGNLADLTGASMAVSSIRASAQGWEVGDEVQLWLGDGTQTRLRVAAVYQRGLGFGDIILDRQAVAGHTARNLDDEVLIRTAPGEDADTALAGLAARYPTSTLVRTDDLTGRLARDLAVSAWLNKLLIGVMVGYAALAAANTMVIAALSRRRELAVLRLTGVTRQQIKNMIHAEQAGLLGVAVAIGGAVAALTLAAVVNALTGNPIPYVPPLGGVAVLGGATLLALTTTVIPVGRLLRTSPTEDIGPRE
ncbi:FtsX-like permease family protein [Plantactinospora sp. WMMB334]|uniref:ABC transporter permease n=1 Tax=Plantactinospora sp. WMMB334 TaxID=3404119 RepID=UPI003B929962